MPLGDIIGQEKASRVFEAYLANKRVAGGYLLTGPDGVGKKALALRVAQALLCSESGNQACGVCPTCARIEKRQHPDVHCIEHEDADIKIEEIRALQRAISLRSYEGGAKVFLIDNAHRLNQESANCLLKVLEEPPAASVIFLVTSKPTKLLKTVVSRCKIVRCPPLDRRRLQELLLKQYQLSPALAHFLAYYSEGSLGVALRLKESLSLEEKNAIIDRFLGPQEFRAGALPREELRFWLSVLASWLRDILMVKTGAGDDEIVNADRSADLRAGARSFSFARLYEIIKVLSDSLLYIEQNVNTRLILSGVHSELSIQKP